MVVGNRWLAGIEFFMSGFGPQNVFMGAAVTCNPINLWYSLNIGSLQLLQSKVCFSV